MPVFLQLDWKAFIHSCSLIITVCGCSIAEEILHACQWNEVMHNHGANTSAEMIVMFTCYYTFTAWNKGNNITDGEKNADYWPW